MRLQPLMSMLLQTAALFTLVACNNSDQTTNNGSDTSKTTSSTTTTTTTSTSSIVTTPQNMLVVRHKVADYDKWKPVYDGHDTARVAAGIHSYVIGRGLQDPGMTLVAMKVDDSAKAMAFTKNPSLKAAMQKGGVVGTPTVHLITMVYQDTSKPASDLRSMSMFTVKDWDNWLKNFESGQQERTDNGLALRAYGHDASDNHKVIVVTALTDSAKAVAYFKSDALKKRMEAAGITSTPDRFLYRVVQRY